MELPTDLIRSSWNVKTFCLLISDPLILQTRIGQPWLKMTKTIHFLL